MDKIFKRHPGRDTKGMLSEINKFEPDNLAKIKSDFSIKNDNAQKIYFESETTPYPDHKHFIGSRDNDEYQGTTHEMASSVFQCKSGDNSKEIRMIRSGTVSLSRKHLDKNKKSEAELKRVESLAKVVASEYLKGVENDQAGETYTVHFLSDNV